MKGFGKRIELFGFLFYSITYEMYDATGPPKKLIPGRQDRAKPPRVLFDGFPPLAVDCDDRRFGRFCELCGCVGYADLSGSLI